jgi:hypothetical protein
MKIKLTDGRTEYRTDDPFGKLLWNIIDEKAKTVTTILVSSVIYDLLDDVEEDDRLLETLFDAAFRTDKSGESWTAIIKFVGTEEQAEELGKISRHIRIVPQ